MFWPKVVQEWSKMVLPQVSQRRLLLTFAVILTFAELSTFAIILTFAELSTFVTFADFAGRTSPG